MRTHSHILTIVLCALLVLALAFNALAASSYTQDGIIVEISLDNPELPYSEQAQTVCLTISLSEVKQVRSFQFELSLPDGISCAGKNALTTGLSAKAYNETNKRFVVYDDSAVPLTTIATIVLDVAPGTAVDTYSIGVNQLRIEDESESFWLNRVDFDTTLTITPATSDPVARIGTTPYATLQGAIDAAQTGDTVVLVKDVALTSMITVPMGKNITLDLTDNGTAYNITCAAGFSDNYLIENSGALTLELGAGNITMDSATTSASAAIKNNTSGTLSIHGTTGVVTNVTAATNPWVLSNNGTITEITGGSFTSSSLVLSNATSGTIAEITGGSFATTGAATYCVSNSGSIGTITGTSSFSSNGSYCLSNASSGSITEISGGSFTSGSIVLYNAGSITDITNGSFTTTGASSYCVSNASTGGIGTITGGSFSSKGSYCVSMLANSTIGTITGGSFFSTTSRAINCAGTITEISGGVFQGGGDYAVVASGGANKGVIGTISGGTFTATKSTGKALYNTNSASNTVLSGGYFKGGEGTAAAAIHGSSYTYPEGKTLSSSTTTSPDTNVDGYYYIAAFVTVSFNANGGVGTMEPQTVEAGLPTALTPNAFTNSIGFIGWATSAEDAETGTFVYTDGQEVTLTESLTLYAVWSDAVARVENADGTLVGYYQTLSAAITAAKNGLTVVLLQDVSAESRIIVSTGYNVTLKLSSHTITSTASDYAVLNRGTLVLDTGTGSIDFNPTGSSSAVLRNNAGCNVTITGSGTLKNNANGGTAYAVNNLGTLAIQGGNLETNKSVCVNNGGTITEISGGSFKSGTKAALSNGANHTIDEISGGEFTSTSGPGLSNEGTITTISGGSFSSESSHALYNNEGTINTIGGNSSFSSVSGNAVYNYGADASIGTIAGGTFTTESSENDKHSLYNNAGQIGEIKGGHFIAAHTALRNHSTGTIELISGGVFESGSGYTIYNLNEIGEISGGTFTSSSGNVIENTKTIGTISGGIFNAVTERSVNNNGSSAWINLISGGTFTAAKACVYNNTGSEIVSITGGVFSGNYCLSNKGSIGSVTGGEFTAKANALSNYSTIGTISGSPVFKSTNDTCVIVQDGGSIGTISGGSFTCEKNTRYALYAYTGSVGEITGGVFRSSGPNAVKVGTSGSIGAISGGSFETTHSTGKALLNEHPGSPIAVTGGYYKTASANRDDAISDRENTSLYTFDGRQLSEDTITSPDTNESGYYYIDVTAFTVTWLNYDGTVLETDENAAPGTLPTYDGATPTKTPAENYSYEFSGWSPAVTAVTGDATYTATFKEVVIVSYYPNYPNGTVGTPQTQTVDRGVESKLNANPFTFTDYSFVGWIGSNGKYYADEEANAIFYGNVALYAEWDNRSDLQNLQINWIDGHKSQTLRTDYVQYTRGTGANGEVTITFLGPLAQPTANAYVGWRFIEWEVRDGALEANNGKIGSATKLANDAVTNDVIEGIISGYLKANEVNTIDLVAIYEQKEETAQIISAKIKPADVELSTIMEVPERIQVGDALHLTAPETYENEAFSYWMYNGTKIANAELMVRVSGSDNITLEAWYGVESEGEQQVYTTDTYSELVNGVKKVAATMAYKVPEGAENVTYGFYRSRTKSEVEGDTEAALVASRTEKRTTNNAGTYTLHISSKSDTFGIWVRAYVKYTLDGTMIFKIESEPHLLDWIESEVR